MRLSTVAEGSNFDSRCSRGISHILDGGKRALVDDNIFYPSCCHREKMRKRTVARNGSMNGIR